MFRSVVRLFPTLGSRLASTMVIRPAFTPAPTSMIFHLKQNLEIASPSQKQFGIMQQICEKVEPLNEAGATEMVMTSVLRKRRLKMKKHKLRKRRKAQRALRIKIGK